jgi:type VI secretion system protein ImpG
MDDQLLNYYERELTFFREMGTEFAKKYPKLAGKLLLEADKCEDPHTERLIEAFAFLCGRVHKKIDDDFPEITEALLGLLYPHYVNPIPSMSVVCFEPVKQNLPETGYRIDKGAALYSKKVDGVPCEFSSVYPVSLWPIEVVSAGLADPSKPVNGAQQVIHLQLKTFNKIPVSQLAWKNLRFFLNGPSQHVFHLYELLFNNVCHVELEAPDGEGNLNTLSLRPQDLCPVGFDAEESTLPYSKRSFPGYLLLFEYFCFPEKLLFFELAGLQRLRTRNTGETLDIRFYLDRPVKQGLVINRDTFALNAAPVINLFQRIAEPIRLEQRHSDYRVIADIRRQQATEIYSIDKVSASVGAGDGDAFEYKPFYSLRHHLEKETRDDRSAFWYSERRPSGKEGDAGTEVYLSFADLGFNPTAPDVEILTLHVTCSNRDLPARLPFGEAGGDFDMEVAGPVGCIRTLLKPTLSCRPSLGGGLQWRLISHLSLNYLSLVEGGEDGLQEILKLYDFENSPTTRQQIGGIVKLQSRYVTRRVGRSFCRGVEVTLTLDEEKFVGTGLFLFACVLERFLGQYVSVNSFSQLVVKTLQRKETLKRWPPRNGNQILL